MVDSKTIDTIVEPNNYFLTNLWGKGRFVLAILGAAYVLNGSYHIVKFNNLAENYTQLRTEVESELGKIFAEHRERVELGLGYGFSGGVLHLELTNCFISERKGRMGVIASELIEEYNLTLNPFYSVP
ncbi:MAG TPA: hypothetical protein VJA23_05395 [Candidatus Nanoarchaeia archaeon]|nr:hypothetical protein [Candidatus Nanoarchaeia archaeon]